MKFDIRSKKRIAINKTLIWLQRCKMGEFRQNDLVREYLSMRLAQLEMS